MQTQSRFPACLNRILTAPRIQRMIADLMGGPSMPNCIVVVQFDLPKRSEEMAVKGGTSTATTYRGLAGKGLIRKDYLNGENGTGGVYLWDSRESAEAWFTEARIADLTERFGVRPRLTWYDTHVTVDNLKGETRVNGRAIEVVA
jgi:hypothetical protein